jgi:MFS transporter, FSR family, fosmidomycin resistance protein
MESETEKSPDAAAVPSGARRILLAACATHLVTDGLIAAIYPLLPLIALELQLSYTAVGTLRTALVAAHSFLQIPAGYLADWIPEVTLLGGGMLWMAVGWAVVAVATGFWPLLIILSVAGLGGNAQHPLATAIVSKAYESGRRATAISSLNFAGDLGKVLLPAFAGLVAVAFGWRGAMLALGAVGIVATAGYALALGGTLVRDRQQRREVARSSGWGIHKPFSFAVLSAIGIVDNSTRVAVLTFLPFLMTEKGLDAAQVSLLITLVFAFGAVGKLGCGLLADRFGNVGVIVITETITALAILAVIPVDPLMLIPVLIAFGFVLNGTSSVLYSAVAEMVHVDRRARGYGLFYTLSLGFGVLAPILYGALADVTSVSGAFVAMAAVTLTTIPLAAIMRRE